MGWLGLMLCVPVILGMAAGFHDYFDTSNGIQEKFHSGSEFSGKKIAILRIEGAIMDGSGFVKHQIERVKNDTDVQAVVIRINSPGGTISGSDYIYHHLKELKKEREIPMVVSMGGIAASGGYYVAMAVGDETDAIFAEPTTTTGSIGVIIPHYDLSGLLEKWDIKEDSLASHPRKKMLSMTKQMTDDDREILTRYLTESFDRFKDIVKSGRPAFRENPEVLDELATGEIFSAVRAEELGLVDKLGFVEDAVNRALELASLKLEDARVVTYAQTASLAGALGLQQVSASQANLSRILGVPTPQAYYLATSLPPLVSTWQASSSE